MRLQGFIIAILFVLVAASPLCAQSTVLLEDFSSVRFGGGLAITCPAAAWRGTWNSSTTYNQCDAVFAPGGPPSFFVSLVNSNLAHTPPVNSNSAYDGYWGAPIWPGYLGENPNQEWFLETGAATSGFVQGKLDATGNSGLYLYFFPVGNPGGTLYFNFPSGYAQSWIRNGTWSSSLNRMTFSYLCTQGVTDGGPAHTVEIGTYILPHGYGDTGYKGQHYYHFLSPNVYASQPVYVTLNQRPEHRVTITPPEQLPDDPEYYYPTLSEPVNTLHYFDGLTAWYFDWVYNQNVGQTCKISGPVQFSQESGGLDGLSVASAAGPQGYIGSITATYSGPMTGYPHGRYEVVFQAAANVSQTYSIAYSTSDMHVGGFSNGTSGGTVTNTGGVYTGVHWYSPDMPQTSSMYVAIQPLGQTDFNEVMIPGPNATTNPCDLNTDGVVNSLDVQIATNQASGAASCGVADLQHNGTCTVVDVQRVVNAASGGACVVGQ